MRSVAVGCGHGELTATGGDIDPAPLAHGAGELKFFREDFLETFRGLAARGRAGVAAGGIERDEIYLRRKSAEQCADRAGLGLRVIFALDQRPLVKDPASGRLAVRAAGGHEFVERPFFGGGHEGGALCLRRSVK